MRDDIHKDSEALHRAVRELLQGDLMALEPQIGGGNNRLWRAWNTSGSFAVKLYPNDARGRLITEFAALQFLASRGVSCVPRPVAAHPEHGVAIYEWVKGQRISATENSGIGAIEAIAVMLAELRSLGITANGHWQQLASAAILSPAQAVGQVRDRLDRIAATGRREVDTILTDCRRELAAAIAWARPVAAAGNVAWNAPLDQAQLTLSPSDVGLHNILQRPDGSLVFLDFEYFGWDDPAKLANDTLDHPGSCWNDDQKARLSEALLPVFSIPDRTYPVRLELLRPFTRLCWVLISLNPFLPGRTPQDMSADVVSKLLAERLDKASAFLQNLKKP